MGSTATEQEAAIGHLDALGQMLSHRGLAAKVVQVRECSPFLRVVNKDAGQLAEDVTLGTYDGEPAYVYSWGDVICPVRHVEAAAERLAHVLAPRTAAEK